MSTGKRLVLLPAAERDIHQAVTYYRQEGGTTLADGFAQAIEHALRHVSRHPATGSMRYAALLGLAGLRHWSIRRFPYLIFYVEREDEMDVWRVLHGQRDMPAWLTGPA